jgi:hypothetical protein
VRERDEWESLEQVVQMVNVKNCERRARPAAQVDVTHGRETPLGLGEKDLRVCVCVRERE